MEPLAVLADDGALPRWALPGELERLYGGGIGFPEPRTVANFVQSVDGVVSIPDAPRSNTLLADASEADRFVVALLRACADAILIGPGTLRASPRATWDAASLYPAAAAGFSELRALRGRPPQPEVAVVTSGGSLDPSHPVLETGAVVLTTAAAAPGLRSAVPAATDVVATGDGDRVDLAAAIAALRERGHEIVLSEAGPSVFAQLLAACLVDELFVTVSPLVAGRATVFRPSLADGVELLPGSRAGGTLGSVRRHGSHLFLRYIFG